MKLLSLFDGSGGFPLAGVLCGITPIAASEVEPYPIAVTKSRFPNMKHLGDIAKINGAEIEPADIITFGSPCQDLSVAGKQAGLKHETNGDDETTRSGLFMEAVRIIKEMRGATNGKYPRFAVWENVPGAFSSNKGEDFKIVLEELIKITEPTAVMPEVPTKGWAYADHYCGDGWSLAYRVLDAQYIRTAQRRRRIYLVLDLRGQCAREILFERQSLRGYSSESRKEGQGTSTDVEGSVGADDRTCYGFPLGFRPENVFLGDGYNQTITGDKSKTLTAMRADADHTPCVAYSIENHPNDSRVKIDDEGKVQALTGRMGTGGGNVPMVMETIALEGNGQRPSHKGNGYAETDKSYTLNTAEVHGVAYEEPIAVDRAFFNQGQNAKYEPQTYKDGTNPTLVAKGPSAVCYWDGSQTAGTLTANNAGGSQRMPDKENFNCVLHTKPNYIVRRLTPTECARLQGFPDTWGHIDHKDDFTDEEYEFWLNVRNTHAEINGKQVKDYTKKQMLTWYNKLHTDSAEYKMYGNGIALPCALYVMQGIQDAINKNERKI